MSKSSDRREKLIARLQLLGEQESTETAMFHQAAAASYGARNHRHERHCRSCCGRVRRRRASLPHGCVSPRSAVTSVLDRLERQSLIIRSQHPRTDARSLCSANTKTLADGDNVYRSIGDAYAALQRGFTTSELEFLVRYYEGVDRGDSARDRPARGECRSAPEPARRESMS